MKRLLCGLVAVWLGLGAAHSAVLLEFVPAAAPIVVAPGETFAFEVRLLVGPDDAVLGFDYYLLAEGANYLNGFSILSRDSDLTYFPELNTSDAEVADPPADAVLASTNTRSLGAAVGDIFSPITGAGTYAVATFVIAVAPDASPGAFTIRSAFASWLDEGFTEHSFTSPAEISVDVVPEPAVFSMVVAGMGLIALARRRRVSGAKGHSKDCTRGWPGVAPSDK